MSLSRFLTISCVVAVTHSMAWAGSLMPSQSTPHTGTVPAAHLSHTTYNVAPFATLSLEGTMTVRLAPAKPGERPRIVMAVSSQKAAQAPRMTSQGGELHIYGTGTGSQITVYTPSLRALNVSDGTSVNGSVSDTRGLKIHTTGHAVVLLKGTFSPAEIKEEGQSVVDLRWVDSPKLVIQNTDDSELRLAGRVGELYARGSEQADLQMTYLRVENAMVSMNDAAVTHITPLKSLRGFASDQAHIYYYKSTPELTVWSRGSGTILQLASHH